MSPWRISATLAFCGLFVACGPKADVQPPLAELASPAAKPSGEPFLAVDRQGAVHMTWIEKTGDSTHAVRYARMADGTWTDPSTIVERNDLFVNWADFPSVLVTPSGRLVAHWLQRSGNGRYAYDVRTAQSSDGGQTWSEGAVLHSDTSPTEHGFVALWNAEGDSIQAAWLDGRHMAGGHGTGGGGAMSLQSVTMAADGSKGREQAIDLRSCDCCQVAGTVSASGPVVAYRDRSDEEIRDIAVVRYVNGEWTEPRVVHNDGWKIAACPVNGPALASRGNRVAIAWFTGAQDTARVLVAFSSDGGASFGAPIQVDNGAPSGRVGIALVSDNDAVVSWLENVPGEMAEVLTRRVKDDGKTGEPFTISETSAARASGFPRIVVRGDDLIAAWTLAGDSAQVRVARVQLEALQ